MAEFSRHMKRWAALTVLLYAVALLLLTVPAIWIAFNGWADKGVSLQNALKIYLRWGYWLWLAVLVAGQALLLLLPINIAERRLPARPSAENSGHRHRVFSGQPLFCRTAFNLVRRF
jgi:phage gp37-like protein